jgi:hypothetical protein
MGTLVGVKNGDNITATYSTVAVPGSHVGSYAINASLLDPDNKLTNYTAVTNGGTLTVTAANLTVTAATKSRDYGASNPVLTGTITGVQNGDNITATYFTPATTTSPVGGYSIIAGLSDPDAKLSNYSLNLTNGTLTINPALLTVIADDQTRVYSAPNPALSSHFNGFVNGETGSAVNGNPALTTAAVPTSPAGAYTIAAATGSLSALNYNFAFIEGTLTITPAVTTNHLASSHNPGPQGSSVTFVATVASLSPATATPVGNVQFLTNGVAFGGPVPLAGGIASLTTSILPVGSCAVMAQYAGDSNFLRSSNSVSQTITAQTAPPGPLSIQVNNDRTVTIQFSGTPGAQYSIEAVADLPTSAWTTIGHSVAAGDGTVSFRDSTAPAFSQRFYRGARP